MLTPNLPATVPVDEQALEALVIAYCQQRQQQDTSKRLDRMPAEQQRQLNALLDIYLPYVKRIARGLARRSTDPVDDIIQVGTLGLLKAFERFNPTDGASFRTYATHLITGEIRHYLRDKTSTIRAPRQLYELYYRVNQIVHHLSQTLGRIPNDGDIAEFLQCPVEDIAQARELDRRRLPVSLDQFLTSDGEQDSGYLERLVDSQATHSQAADDIRLTLQTAMAGLRPELRQVVEMTYFQDLSQYDIAKALNVSQMQVSRRLRKALDLLSKVIRQD